MNNRSGYEIPVSTVWDTHGPQGRYDETDSNCKYQTKYSPRADEGAQLL